MFRIGDFSKLTRVSIKMLRHYDDIGLLKPVRVDLATNYRYYSADQLPRLNRIIALKDLGFSLEQIAMLLDERLSTEELRGMLKLRRAEIAERLRIEQLRMAQIDARLRTIEHAEQHSLYDVVARKVAPQLMATIRQVVASPGEPISRLFDEVEAYSAHYQARAASGPLTIFHDPEYREEDLDVEVAVPITRVIPSTARVVVREVAGADQMACVVYTGGYARMGDVLHALLIWIEANGYAIAGELREVYLRFGADRADELRLPQAFLTDQPALYVTEVQIPIELRRSECDAIPTTGA
jgi:DNA-binding transcriptional MerR regulator